MIGYIYKLVCKKSSSPIYVGATTVQLSVRLKAHILNSGSNKGVQEYLSKNKVHPAIEVLEEVGCINKSTLLKRETYWIKKLAKQYILLNRNNNISVKTGLIKVDTDIKNRVAKKVAGTPQTIGEFYDDAVSDKLSKK